MSDLNIDDDALELLRRFEALSKAREQSAVERPEKD